MSENIVTVSILKKEYINETGFLLVVNFSANYNNQTLNLRYGYDITQMNLENCQPFMDIDDSVIESWLLNDVSTGIQTQFQQLP